MIQETDFEGCVVKVEGASDPPEKKQQPRSSSLIDSLLFEDGDDVIITDSYKRSTKEMAQEEIKHYMEMPKHTSPLLFWNVKKVTLPNLAKLAGKYLVAQATLVASERVFSTSGDILSAKRSCMDPDSLDCMIFLKKNATKDSEFIV